MDIQISLFIPVLNETDHIENLIKDLIEALPFEKEIFLIDGGSTDGTIDKIIQKQKYHANINLVHNEERFVSHGFNKAFPFSKGKYISLMVAHASYPPSFFYYLQFHTIRIEGNRN
jgi:CDP-ribitol ribitolphosphotransferase / teichoic acid ribitol-phosphate polymerase